MDVLGSFVSLENRRINCNNNNENSGNNENANLNNTTHSTNNHGNKTSFLIDDILFPAKLRTDSSRQVLNSLFYYLNYINTNIINLLSMHLLNYLSLFCQNCLYIN